MFVEHKEVGETQPLKIGFPKLSAAIRIGALLHPQGKVRFFADGRTCALGAALDGVGKGQEARKFQKDTGTDAWNLVNEIWPGTDGLDLDIASMNDRGETREAIADWLEERGF